jgi:hypothetical protein
MRTTCRGRTHANRITTVLITTTAAGCLLVTDAQARGGGGGHGGGGARGGGFAGGHVSGLSAGPMGNHFDGGRMGSGIGRGHGVYRRYGGNSPRYGYGYGDWSSDCLPYGWQYSSKWPNVCY